MSVYTSNIRTSDKTSTDTILAGGPFLLLDTISSQGFASVVRKVIGTTALLVNSNLKEKEKDLLEYYLTVRKSLTVLMSIVIYRCHLQMGIFFVNLVDMASPDDGTLMGKKQSNFFILVIIKIDISQNLIFLNELVRNTGSGISPFCLKIKVISWKATLSLFSNILNVYFINMK